MLKGCLVTIGVFFALIVGFIALFFAMGESGSWNYKVTVTVTTPEGEVTGSAVRNVSNTVYPMWFDLPQVVHSADVRGEAVVVDLGKRGLVFALVDDKDDMRLNRIFQDGSFFSPQGLRKFKKTLVPGKNGIFDPCLTPTYPPIVTFKNLDDPTSVVSLMEWGPVNPRQPSCINEVKVDRFPEIFGEGVYLKSMEFEITDEPLSHNDEVLLPLYKDQKAYMDWIKSLPYDSPKRILPSNFGRVRR